MFYSGKQSFAPPDQLFNTLEITPGSVTIFTITNDVSQRVEVYLDRELWDYEDWHAHPMTNTSTLVIQREDALNYMINPNHSLQVIDIPVKG
jgi:Ala-tRNA(Pro) deacylase